MKKSAIIVVLSLALLAGGCGGSSSDKFSTRARSVLSTLSLNQKIGQMFIIHPVSVRTDLSVDVLYRMMASGEKIPEEQAITDQTRRAMSLYPAGGFLLNTANIASPTQLKQFTSDLKGVCLLPPFIAIDEEGGRVARLGNHPSFDLPNPGPMQDIGSTGDTELAHAAGSTIGSYIREYGFNLDFAPVADVNTNPNNIVIGTRSFGSDPELVSQMVSAFLGGLHEHQVFGTIKHFPGHGDTTNDTHSGYVAVYKTWEELLSAEIIPFRDNLSNTDLVMTAHITMKNVTSEDVPATLSRVVLTDKLRGELGYDGVIITDSMGMGAILNDYPSGEAAVRAIEAGADIILTPRDYAESFNAVLEAVRTGRITQSRINESVLRILKLKYREW